MTVLDNVNDTYDRANRTIARTAGRGMIDATQEEVQELGTRLVAGDSNGETPKGDHTGQGRQVVRMFGQSRMDMPMGLERLPLGRGSQSRPVKV